MPILADLALEARRNMIAGANKNDYHLRNVTPGERFQAEFVDLRQVSRGRHLRRLRRPARNCTRPSRSATSSSSATSIPTPWACACSAPNGEEVTPIMGSYGIGIERILGPPVEQNHDEAGMFLPVSIAPFTVIVTPVNNADAALREAARKIYDDCLAAGIDALYDDRDERPGVKFKDADLIGVPLPRHRRQETRAGRGRTGRRARAAPRATCLSPT